MLSPFGTTGKPPETISNGVERRIISLCIHYRSVMKQLISFLLILLLLSASFTTFAQSAAPLSALARMPVKEVTVFKDGHAFVLHEGTMPTDASGNVVMDYLPAPVLGTFWAYAADTKSKLSSVVAGQRRVQVERTALRLAEMLEANPGAEVLVTEKPLLADKT